MKILRCLPLLLCLLFAGCVKNEIKLRFEVPESVSGPYRVLYYASGKNQGMMRETAVEIARGKGEITLPTVYPSIVYVFSSTRKEPELAFYAERGDNMLITGDTPDVGEWKVDGNKLSREWSDWRYEHRQLLKSDDSERINAEVAKYVEKNPDSPLSMVLLTVYYSRRADQAGFSRLYGLLKEGAFSNGDLMSALSAADLIEGPQQGWFGLKGGKGPVSLVLLGEKGYADTLNLKDTVPALLLFADKEGLKDGALDSISALSAKSRSRVAEIYVDVDSLGWKRHLRKDSVAGMRRMMMPMGLADSLAISLGIARAPYYITVGPKGQLVYRGDDFKKALKEFRKLSK